MVGQSYVYVFIGFLPEMANTDVQCSGHPDTTTSGAIASRFFQFYLGVISQERLKIDVKLLLSANRKSYIPRQLAQQRMTFSDLERRYTKINIIAWRAVCG